MKSRPFAYRRVSTLAEAFAARAEAIAAGNAEVSWLAGGHSIVPALNLRLQAPDILIDISPIAELHGVIMREDGWLRIGALTPHAAALEMPLIGRHAPLLAQAAAHVGHPAIRNRATIGGNLALADPASEFPAVLCAAGATLTLASARGIRCVTADDFFVDLFTTIRADDEILTEIAFPPLPPRICSAFNELSRRRGDYAMTGLAAQLRLQNGAVNSADLVFCAMGPTPVRALTAQAALHGKPLTDATIAAAVAGLGDDLEPQDETGLPGATRLHLAGVLMRRVLTQLRDAQTEDRHATA